MNKTKHSFTSKLGLAFGFVLLTALTGCLPGMRNGPPGLPGLPEPPHAGIAAPSDSPAAIVATKDSSQDAYPQLFQTDKSVNTVSKEEEANE